MYFIESINVNHIIMDMQISILNIFILKSKFFHCYFEFRIQSTYEDAFIDKSISKSIYKSFRIDKLQNTTLAKISQ